MVAPKPFVVPPTGPAKPVAPKAQVQAVELSTAALAPTTTLLTGITTPKLER